MNHENLVTQIEDGQEFENAVRVLFTEQQLINKTCTLVFCIGVHFNDWNDELVAEKSWDKCETHSTTDVLQGNFVPTDWLPNQRRHVHHHWVLCAHCNTHQFSYKLKHGDCSGIVRAWVWHPLFLVLTSFGSLIWASTVSKTAENNFWIDANRL